MDSGDAFALISLQACRMPRIDRGMQRANPGQRLP
jgi:hypothetical protein